MIVIQNPGGNFPESRRQELKDDAIQGRGDGVQGVPGGESAREITFSRIKNPT